MKAARAAPCDGNGPARPDWRRLGAVAVVDGVGYWAARHPELRPVTGLRLVAGCA